MNPNNPEPTPQPAPQQPKTPPAWVVTLVGMFNKNNLLLALVATIAVAVLYQPSEQAGAGLSDIIERLEYNKIDVTGFNPSDDYLGVSAGHNVTGRQYRKYETEELCAAMKLMNRKAVYLDGFCFFVHDPLNSATDKEKAEDDGVLMMLEKL